MGFGVWGLGFGVWGLVGFAGVWGLGIGLGLIRPFKPNGAAIYPGALLGPEDLRGLEFGLQSLGFRVWG